MPLGPQSPPATGVDLLSRSFTSPNISFAGKESIFALAGSGGGGGVSEINNISGAINIESSDGSVTITEAGETINMSVNFPVTPAQGDITSTDGSITLTTVGDDINMSVNFPAVEDPTSINGLDGAVTLVSHDNTLIISEKGQGIEIEINPDAVITYITAGSDKYSGPVTFKSSGGTVLFTDDNGDINLESVSVAGVETLNSIAGAVTLSSPNNSVAINVSGQNIQLQTVSGGPANALSGTGCSVTALQPQFGTDKATISLNADGGSGGSIDILAQSGGIGQSGGAISIHSKGGNGIGALYGAVRLTADAGHDLLTQITTGGLVEITANTGLAIGALCSIVRTNAASIQSFAGAIPVIPSANPGFQTIYGNQGISMTAGWPGVLPQVPLSIYMYAPTGISLDSGVYTNNVFPYWSGAGAVSNLNISGRNFPQQAYVVLNDVKSIAMGSTGSITGVQEINGVVYPPPPIPIYQATYYKTVNQDLLSPETLITFDAVADWNNDGGYITHESGTNTFTVVQKGLYQLEFNLHVGANGATWDSTNNKSVAIRIFRAGMPEGDHIYLQNSCLQADNTSYQQSFVTSFYLDVDDSIIFTSYSTYYSGTPYAVAVQDVYSLNTTASWRFIS